MWKLEEKIQVNSFRLQFGDWILQKRIEKIIWENAFKQKKKEPGLNFNPGLALISLETTGPWFPQPRQ